MAFSLSLPFFRIRRSVFILQRIQFFFVDIAFSTIIVVFFIWYYSLYGFVKVSLILSKFHLERVVDTVAFIWTYVVVDILCAILCVCDWVPLYSLFFFVFAFSLCRSSLSRLYCVFGFCFTFDNFCNQLIILNEISIQLFFLQIQYMSLFCRLVFCLCCSHNTINVSFLCHRRCDYCLQFFNFRGSYWLFSEVFETFHASLQHRYSPYWYVAIIRIFFSLSPEIYRDRQI